MPTHLPPLNALRAFEAAARLMSFTKAAAELHVTPAAVSHQIHALEADLEVKLFHRRNRAIELTPSARLLLPSLSDAFGSIHSAVARVRAHHHSGALTVTAGPSFAAKWLVPRLHRFQEQHPDVDVRISASNEIVDLANSEFDIALRSGHGDYPGLAVELLMETEVFPASSPSLLEHGPPLRSPADLGRHILIHDEMVDRDPLFPSWGMWLKAAGVSGIKTDRGLRFNDSHLAIDAAIGGRGVVLANSTIAAADIAAGKLVRLFSLALPSSFSYYIVTLPGAEEQPKVKAFCAWLRKEAEKDRVGIKHARAASPSTPTVPLEGGGGVTGVATASSPPLRGRDRVGGRGG